MLTNKAYTVKSCRVIAKTQIECKHCRGRGTLSIVEPESLRLTREDAGLSLRQFAKQVGFTPPYISDIENGRRACTFEIEEAYSKLKPKKGK